MTDVEFSCETQNAYGSDLISESLCSTVPGTERDLRNSYWKNQRNQGTFYFLTVVDNVNPSHFKIFSHSSLQNHFLICVTTGKAAITKSCKYMKAQHKRFFFSFFSHITILRGCWDQQGRVLFHPGIFHFKVLPSPEPGHHLPAGRVSESICWQIFQARPGYMHVVFCSLSIVGEHRHMATPTLWGMENVL